MRRAYLDTNILVYMGTNDRDSLSEEVFRLVYGCETLLYTSTECVKELISTMSDKVSFCFCSSPN